MPIWNVTTVLSVAAGLSASAAALRKALGKEVDRRAEKLIDDAVIEAREEIRKQADSILSMGFLRFMWTTLAKLSLVLATCALFLFGVLEANWSAYILGGLFVCFFVYDIVRNWAMLRYVWREVSVHGLRPKTILAEAVSVQVFERVLERASEQPVDRMDSVLMLLAGRDRDEMSTRIAEAVSEIAATTSWDDIRPLVRRFALRFAILFLFYFGIVWTMIFLVRMG